MPYNPYAPIQEELRNIGGIMERGATRGSEHAYRMGLLGLQGEQLGMQRKRLGMEEETHAKDIGIKGLQLQQLERVEAQRVATESKLDELSGLRSWDSYEDTVGPDPSGKKRAWLMEIVPKDKHLLNQKGEIVGFNVKRKEVPRIASRLIGKMDPLDIAENRKYLFHNRDWLINYAGATENGTDEYSQALRANDAQLKMANDLYKASLESPLAFAYAKRMQLGEKELTPEEKKGAKLYEEVQTLKAAKTTWGAPFQDPLGGWSQQSSTGQISRLEKRQELTPYQKAQAPKELNDYAYGLTHTKEGAYIEPSKQDKEAIRSYASQYGYDAIEAETPKERLWGLWPDTMETGFTFVPKQQATQGKGLNVTGGPEVAPRLPGETIADYLKRTGQQ